MEGGLGAVVVRLAAAIRREGGTVTVRELVERIKDERVPAYHRMASHALARLIQKQGAAGCGDAFLVPPPAARDPVNSDILALYARKRQSAGARADAAADEKPRKRKVRRPADLESAVAAEIEPPNAARKRPADGFPASPPPGITLDAVGGCEAAVRALRELIVEPLRRPDLVAESGDLPVTGVVLYGPPGSGKTLAALGTAGEAGVTFFNVSAPELVEGVSGDSEKALRALFESAMDQAPSLIFLDELDAICSKTSSSGANDVERRIVAQLKICMSSLAGKAVIVLAATNHINALDTKLRVPGRFDDEVPMGMPDVAAREAILRAITRERHVHLAQDVNLSEIAQRTPGFVGADLFAVVKKAQLRCFRRLLAEDPDRVPNEPVAGAKSNKVGPFSEVTGDLKLTSEAVAQTVVDECSTESGFGSEAASCKASDTIVPLCSPASAKAILPESGPAVEDSPLPSMSLSLPAVSPAAADGTCRRPAPPGPARCVTQTDLMHAIAQVQPCALREGFATVPNVRWANVGGLSAQRSELEEQICDPARHFGVFKELGLAVPAGALLYGPPGCGKTLLARAVAAESGANFISVKGPELLNKYVGESERAVRQLFERARASAPCVIFFDEIDSICARRGGSAAETSSVRVVNQLLTEMDGAQGRENVYVIAATNRPDHIDPAMLRPGRLDRCIYVALPDCGKRLQILQALARRMRVAADFDFEEIAAATAGFSGADLAALLRQGLRLVFRKMKQRARVAGAAGAAPAEAAAAPAAAADLAGAALGPEDVLTTNLAREALKEVRPSVTPDQIKEYDLFKGARERTGDD